MPGKDSRQRRSDVFLGRYLRRLYFPKACSDKGFDDSPLLIHLLNGGLDSNAKHSCSHLQQQSVVKSSAPGYTTPMSGGSE